MFVTRKALARRTFLRGAAPGHWEPKSSEPGFEFPFVFKPLERHRKNVVLTTGMWSSSAETLPASPGPFTLWHPRFLPV